MNSIKQALLIIAMLQLLAISCQAQQIDKKSLKAITPDFDFTREKSPAAPDYSDPRFWAALPDVEDFADLRPEGIPVGDPRLKLVDVFFIHPTSYFRKNSWNDPLDLESGTSQNTDALMANNASIFNDCKVYAPRYRQATIVTFLDMDGKNEKQALDLAYEDVKRSFEHFLSTWNKERPFVLAGHSQGSYHGKRLIDEFIDGKPLSKRMIAAYLLGNSEVSNEWADNLKSLKVCDSPTQQNCIINFNTCAEKVKPSADWGKEEAVCVNPLSWRRDGGYEPASAHLGFVETTGTTNFKLFGSDKPNRIPIGPLQRPLTAHTHATCENGVLLIEDQKLAFELMKGNYHAIELSLFHMNLRANVAQRCIAYLD